MRPNPRVNLTRNGMLPRGSLFIRPPRGRLPLRAGYAAR